MNTTMRGVDALYTTWVEAQRLGCEVKVVGDEEWRDRQHGHRRLRFIGSNRDTGLVKLLFVAGRGKPLVYYSVPFIARPETEKPGVAGSL